MAHRRQHVLITPKTATRWQDLPKRLFARRKLRDDLMRRTIEQSVLPMLQHLEYFYLKENMGAVPRVYGKTLKELEQDDVALEAALYLFDLGVEEGMIVFQRQNGKQVTGQVPDNIPLGPCGYSIARVKRRFLDVAIRRIAKNFGVPASSFRGVRITDVRDLKKIRKLAGFGGENVGELKSGFSNLAPLLEKDEEYLSALYRCCEVKYLRAMRYSMGERFPEILNVPAAVIGSLADNIDHKAKVMAIGDTILDTTRPEVIRALGTWPMSPMDTDEEGEEKINVGKTRIAQVKNLLDKDFDILMTWGPTVVLEAGNWTDGEIKMLQPYMSFLNREIMENLVRLPLNQGVDILDGLSRRLGNSFIEKDLREPDGTEVIKGIVGEVISMNKRLSTPDNLRRLILETRMLDQYMGKFLKRKTSLTKPVERSG